MREDVIADMPDPKSIVPPVSSTPSSAAICFAHASFVGDPHREYTKPSSSVYAASSLSCSLAPWSASSRRYVEPKYTGGASPRLAFSLGW